MFSVRILSMSRIRPPMPRSISRPNRSKAAGRGIPRASVPRATWARTREIHTGPFTRARVSKYRSSRSEGARSAGSGRPSAPKPSPVSARTSRSSAGENTSARRWFTSPIRRAQASGRSPGPQAAPSPHPNRTEATDRCRSTGGPFRGRILRGDREARAARTSGRAPRAGNTRSWKDSILPGDSSSPSVSPPPTEPRAMPVNRLPEASSRQKIEPADGRPGTLTKRKVLPPPKEIRSSWFPRSRISGPP